MIIKVNNQDIKEAICKMYNIYYVEERPNDIHGSKEIITRDRIFITIDGKEKEL